MSGVNFPHLADLPGQDPNEGGEFESGSASISQNERSLQHLFPGLGRLRQQLAAHRASMEKAQKEDPERYKRLKEDFEISFKVS